MHTPHTSSPSPGRAGERRRGLSLAALWGLPGGVRALRRPQSGRGCCRKTIGPTLKTGVASWPGVRSLTLSQSGARYSSVGGKGHKLGRPPDPVKTPDFGVLPPPGGLKCTSPTTAVAQGSGPRPGRVGECGQASDGKPTHVPLPRHARKARNNCLAKFPASPHPPYPQSGKGGFSGRGGRGNGLGTGSSASSFSRDRNTGEGRRPPVCSRPQSGGAWPAATSALGRGAAGAVQSLGRRETPFAFPPPSCRLAGAGVSPAAEAYSWQ